VPVQTRLGDDDAERVSHRAASLTKPGLRPEEAAAEDASVNAAPAAPSHVSVSVQR
jgi:hypothetical protein